MGGEEIKESFVGKCSLKRSFPTYTKGKRARIIIGFCHGLKK
ncbi:unnamed protein product [marine sediment metagenome]|uniref:Uncharacterized protein n=1 Tax=marine sediment metagenome TaxID=412755 RepID=X1E3D6_9ZZZZ